MDFIPNAQVGRSRCYVIGDIFWLCSKMDEELQQIFYTPKNYVTTQYRMISSSEYLPHTSERDSDIKSAI